MHRRSFVAASAAVTLVSTRPAFAQSLQPVTIGLTPTDDATPMLYAQSAGLLRKAGFDATITPVSSGTATLAAVMGGTFMFGAASSIAYVTAKAKGFPFQLFAPSGIYNSTTDFVWTLCRKDATIQTAADFNGKLFASPGVTDLNTVAFLGWMSANGGDASSVKFLEVPYSAIVPAIETGRVDAATLIQPQLGLALRGGKLRGFAKTYDSIAKSFFISCWLTTTDFGAANPDMVRRMASVLKEASIYCNNNKLATAPLLADWTKIDLEVIKASGRDTYGTTGLDTVNLQPIIDACVKYKVIAGRYDANDLINPAVKNFH